MKNDPLLTIQNPKAIKLPALVERIQQSGSGQVGERYVVVKYQKKIDCFYEKSGKGHNYYYLKLIEENYQEPRELMLEIEKDL